MKRRLTLLLAGVAGLLAPLVGFAANTGIPAVTVTTAAVRRIR